MLSPSTLAHHSIRPGASRLHIFHNLPRDTMIECLPPFREVGVPPKYPPITYGEYAELRYRQAHGGDKQLKLQAK